MNNGLLADLILIIHFLFVIFALGGEVVIVIGGIAKWSWVRSLYFRVTHLILVIIVAIEAAVGIICPLTVWEYRLRLKAGQRVEEDITFVGRLLSKIIYYDFPPWVFTLSYIVFALLVAGTLLLVPPKRHIR